MAVEVKTMEVKKTHQFTATGTAKDAPMTAEKAQDFISDIRTEFSKVTWTSPEELRAYTKMVVAATFLFGIGIYIIDLIIQGSLGILAALVRLIAG